MLPPLAAAGLSLDVGNSGSRNLAHDPLHQFSIEKTKPKPPYFYLLKQHNIYVLLISAHFKPEPE